jgi:hypothetical protein
MYVCMYVRDVVFFLVALPISGVGRLVLRLPYHAQLDTRAHRQAVELL